VAKPWSREIRNSAAPRIDPYCSQDHAEATDESNGKSLDAADQSARHSYCPFRGLEQGKAVAGCTGGTVPHQQQGQDRGATAHAQNSQGGDHGTEGHMPTPQTCT
jgi:hypothetical protein